MRQLPRHIALVGNSLSSGGAEKVQARLSFYFENQGIAVHHIIVSDEVTYPYAGSLFNMGKLKTTSNGPLNKLKRLQALQQYLKVHAIECVIDFRVKANYYQEHIIANWVYSMPYIITVRSYDTSYYFPNKLSKAKAIFKKAKNIVAVSKALETKIRNDYQYPRVTTIYNPIDFKAVTQMANEESPIEGKYLLAVGRMVNNIKQFDHLINAFVKAKLSKKGYQLVLLGQGEDKEVYRALAERLGVSDAVVFPSFNANPFPLFKGARCTVLTSKFEGFPNVLLESLAVGTPVVSYDCLSGPSEIIKKGENGILVPHNDQKALAEALTKIVENEAFYNRCKKEAQHSIAAFDVSAIGEQWLQVLSEAIS
ncbi:MAG: glycosyltransferase [Bacteroidetes bacterium]|nr:glycosyltransferase [Bacteroidota bacterium]